jgi:hypothetical protein
VNSTSENLMKATLSAAQDRIRNKLAVVYCSEHHQNPTVEFMPDAADGFKYRLHACCDSALRAAESALEK